MPTVLSEVSERGTPVPGSSGASLVVEDHDNDKKKAITTEMPAEEMPWHHEQLYRLYGAEADNFLHPKPKPKVVKPFNAKIKKQSGKLNHRISINTCKMLPNMRKASCWRHNEKTDVLKSKTDVLMYRCTDVDRTQKFKKWQHKPLH